MIETAKIIEALCYLLGRVGRANKLKLVKLLYLADKCHLIRYGRTITGDEYWAMDYGPVGSAAKDILGFDFDYASTPLKKVGEFEFETEGECKPEELNTLSETDIESLQLVVERFGEKTASELVHHTHHYPEWAQYQKLFQRKQTKRERIKTEELFSTLAGDPFETSPEHMEESKRILMGISD